METSGLIGSKARGFMSLLLSTVDDDAAKCKAARLLLWQLSVTLQRYNSKMIAEAFKKAEKSVVVGLPNDPRDMIWRRGVVYPWASRG